MKLPTINLDLLRSIPLVQKVGLLLMVLAGIIVGLLLRGRAKIR